MKTSRPSGERGRASVLLLAVVAGIVLGIVGMHGLTHQTEGAAADSSMTSQPVQNLGARVMGHSAMDPGGHEGHGTPGHGDDCDLIACCLAVILAGGLLLWALFVSRAPRCMTRVKRATAVRLEQLQSAVRRPPDLFSLSILRC
jgi:uncharacterized protein DUF6153